MDRSLTLEEQTFAAEHHDLVHRYLRQRHLSEDDFYDVVIFRYLRAVRQYLERESLRQYAFSTIAYHAMDSSVGHYYESRNRKKHKATVLSLDYPMGGNETLRFGDTVADARVDIDAEVRVKQFFNSVDDRERGMLFMRARGYSVREIAKRHAVPSTKVVQTLDELYDAAHELLAA
jgi:RNA polymerase sigma-70 factor (ECF subfamily)